MSESFSGAVASATTPSLQFASKYTPTHALHYFEKHQTGFQQRLSNWWEKARAREALAWAGYPRSVLDLPCGTGRFWDLLAEQPDRLIYAADLNQPMIETALQKRAPELVARVQAFQASAFAIDLPDEFVETVFCMRLLHHIRDSEHRLQILRELARVCSNSVVVSLWVDGNFKAWRWRVKDRKRGHRNRFVLRRPEVEAEFRRAGLHIVRRLDFLRYYSMWTFYVLAKE